MPFSRASLHVRLGDSPLPYFHEYGPFLWGEAADYDSDGNAYDEKKPTYWTMFDIRHRQTNERVLITPLPNRDDPPPTYRDAQGRLKFTVAPTRERVSVLLIQGDYSHSVRLAAYLTAFRSHGVVFDPETARNIALNDLAASVQDIDERVAIADAFRIIAD